MKYLLLPFGYHEEWPWPGLSMAKMEVSGGSNGIKGFHVPALSCHPCNARIGCLFLGPHRTHAIFPHGTGI